MYRILIGQISLTILFIANSVIASPTFLYFEDLPIGTRIDEEYAALGVHFYNDYEPGQSWNNSPTIAQSPSNRSPQVLQNKASDPEIFSSYNIPLAAWFDHPVTGVGMWLFKSPSCYGNTVNATVTLYDCAGDQVAQNTVAVNAAGTPFQLLDPTGQAMSVFVDYGATPCEEIIDDLAFDLSTNTCFDNSKPLVFITSPGYVSSTNNSSIVILGQVYETSKRLASMQINGQDVSFRPRDGNPSLFDFNFSVPLSEGKNNFTILAVDAAGNKGSAQVYVNRGTPTNFTVKNLHITQRGLMEDEFCDLDTPFVAGKSTIIRLDLDVLTATGYKSFFNSVDLRVYRKTLAGDVLTGTYIGHGFSPYQVSFDSVTAMSGIHFFLDGDVFPVAGEYRLNIIPYVGIAPLTEAALTSSICPSDTYLTFTETKPVKLGILPVEAGLYNPFQVPSHLDDYLGQLATLARTYPVRDGFSTIFATSFETGVKWLEFPSFNSCDGSQAMKKDSKWCDGTGFEWTFIDKDPSGTLQYVETTPVAATTETVCNPNQAFLGGKEATTGRILHTVNYTPALGLFRGGAHPSMEKRYYPICDDDHDGSITQADIQHYVAQFYDADASTPSWTTNLNKYTLGDTYRNFVDNDNNNCQNNNETEAPVTGLWRNAKNILFPPAVEAIASHNSYYSGSSMDLDYGVFSFPWVVHPLSGQLFYGPGSASPKQGAAWVRITDDQTLAHECGHLAVNLPDDYGSPDPPRHQLHPWQAYNGFDRFTAQQLNSVYSVMWRSSSPPSKYFFPKNYYQQLFDKLKISGSDAAKTSLSSASTASARSFLVQGLIGPGGEPRSISGAIVPYIEATAPDVGGNLIITTGNGATTLNTLTIQPESPTHDQVQPDSSAKYFSAVLNLPPAATWVKVMQEGGPVLAEFLQTSSSPVSAFITPVGGEMFSAGETVPITWAASDDDSDQLFHTLYYSANGDTDWILVASQLTGTSYTLDHSTLPGTNGTARLKLRTSDGFNFYESVSAPFSLARKGPQATILYPEDGRVYTICQADPNSGGSGGRYENLKEKFKAAVFDPEGDIKNMYWLVDMSGPFGTTDMMDLDMSDFSPGKHTIRIRVSDNDGKVSYDEMSVTVLPDSDCDGMSDTYEEMWGLDIGNTNDADLDGDDDGLSNVEEAWYETRPDEWDSDGDDIGDGVEVNYGLNPRVDDAMDDMDGDGYSNILEIEMNTSPNDGSDSPSITMQVVEPVIKLKKESTVDVLVRLTASPPRALAISAEVTSWNPGVYIGTISTAAFDSSNWASWQTVSVLAKPWIDPRLGPAVVTVSVNGLPDVAVEIDLADTSSWLLFYPAIFGATK